MPRKQNSMSTSSPVLRSMNFGCAGRPPATRRSRRRRVGSTGLVNAVAVLLVGTSSRHTRVAASARRVRVASGSRRRAGGGSRRSAARRTATPARSRGRARADTTAAARRVLACSGRSSLVRFSPAHISFAHTSSAITRGSGPISAAIERGSANARRGSNRRSIHSHSWMSLKNRARRPDQVRLRARQQLPAGAAAHVVGVRRVRVLADQHPVDARRPTRRRAPASRRRGRRGRGARASSQRPTLISAKYVCARLRARQRRGQKPPLRVLQPQLRDVQLAGAAAREPLLARRPRRERQRARARPCQRACARAARPRRGRGCASSRSRISAQQLGPLGEIVEQRAARGEHQLVERALQARAPQRAPRTRACPGAPAPGRPSPRRPRRRTRAGRTAALEPADLPVQIVLIPHSW